MFPLILIMTKTQPLELFVRSSCSIKTVVNSKGKKLVDSDITDEENVMN